ncbi:hypothetical protein C8Q74DRAFT_265654 [Fomes fomentarius]|nr:hypothetical protein C8Q74DRAFT_265654 [Fomes fomentarius]
MCISRHCTQSQAACSPTRGNPPLTLLPICVAPAARTLSEAHSVELKGRGWARARPAHVARSRPREGFGRYPLEVRRLRLRGGSRPSLSWSFVYYIVSLPHLRVTGSTDFLSWSRPSGVLWGHGLGDREAGFSSATELEASKVCFALGRPQARRGMVCDVAEAGLGCRRSRLGNGACNSAGPV